MPRTVANLRWTSWLRTNKTALVLGVPLFGFALAPSPFGCGMVYPISDTLRGHPQRPHGTRPKTLVGFWIREESVMYDSLGQAFYLMPDGRFAGTPGMTRRRWHFDGGRLFLDSVSLCGNCYRGNVTTEYTIKFVGSDRLSITNRDPSAERGIAGEYRRVRVDATLRSRMSRLKESPDEESSFRGRTVLRAIEHSEMLSKSTR